MTFHDVSIALRLAEVIRRLTAKQASFAARVDECHSHPKQFASADDYLAEVNGTSRGEAKRTIDTAHRMKRCPTTAAAFDQGELSVGEADLISGAAVLDPAAETELVGRATRSHDLTDTRERTTKVKASARHGEDPAARQARLRARRRWCEFDDDDMHAVAARFLPEEWARVAPVIDAYANARFEQACRHGQRDPEDAYRADAVLAALTAAGEAAGLTPPTTTEPAEPTEPVEDLLKVRPSRFKWNVCILIDGIALQRGHATATETSEIPGIGPVDVAWVSRLLPHAIVDVLVHDLVDIKAHATLTRHRRKALDTALRARDRRCVVPGCRRRRRLQADHRHDFARGGETSGANLELLCEVHHADKTHRGARIERTHTQWLWYPPPPPAPGQPQPPPGSIPWRAPIGEHLTPFDLDELPTPIEPEPEPEPDDTLPFR